MADEKKNKHTRDDLSKMQALPLNVKIKMTERRIREWVDYFGIDGVHISFSGGKDSTVLLDIARKMYPDIKAVHVNTSLEFPEIEKFVRTFDNVEIIRPKMNFVQTITKYGYPVFSKEISETVYGARKYLATLAKRTTMPDQSILYYYELSDLIGNPVRKEDLQWVSKKDTISQTDRQTDRQTDKQTDGQDAVCLRDAPHDRSISSFDRAARLFVAFGGVRAGGRW